MRGLVSSVMGLLCFAAGVVSAVCLFYLPGALREHSHEPTDLAMLCIGTFILLLTFGIYLRAALLGFRIIQPRKPIDLIALSSLVLIDLTLVASLLRGEIKSPTGVWPTSVVLLSTWAYWWIFRSIGLPPNHHMSSDVAASGHAGYPER